MPKCRRCGEEYTDPVPKVKNPQGTKAEIATPLWCPKCNAFTMGVLWRGDSIYSSGPEDLQDPLKGGKHESWTNSPSDDAG